MIYQFKSLFIRIIFLSSQMLISSCASDKPSENSLSVGAAFGIINPAPGDFIAGDRNNRKFSGVHDPLFVKAVVVSDSQHTVAIITVDCIGLLYPTLLEIREAVARQISPELLDPSHIVSSSTHTHSGPDVVGLWGQNQQSSGVNTEYMQRLVQIAAAKIIEAFEQKQPAELHYAETTYGEDWVYNISKPEELDRSLGVLQFTDLNGNSIATLTNFACHPTFMDGTNDEVSSDFIGGFYEAMDQELGGTNQYLQGSIGGWVQPEYEEKSFPNAFKRGRELADAVLSSLKNSKATVSTDIQFNRSVFSLPVSNEGFRQLASMGVIDRAITDSVETEIAWFRVGDAEFITHPGETSPVYSLESKKLMNTTGPKFVLGLGMDGLGYIVTPDFFDAENEIPHSEYLTGMSVDKNAGEIILQVIESLTNPE
ncbi:neutral/alkaline non-lysosomal ceramidase N-terminal domain-containing protein [Fulvivirga sedimenti]|uniref:Neutral/alkaline non-lysosomal ceramidase N-terminal domain-containing protein n=1 Tax=Fulvivirga sedimenti TaxID=2879465 RepID=A0A9X1HQT9_9BACT|nr:neutral/alkaline non-lysosomal ceramidase N-terminal domain-containing protein [Fulvivirga sedimenti]MCA6075057.1 neutral/alkaline non-lysosomal ceramidase N-terminal domain-containing protein [Fulvivirga sedimenti]MCA6076234.1 neutral/alkaline non-lysosomal ceramidase N-terminal domain-containing protein [Fulvivirga sedimenti]MCA6077362.1 neutral/alkaline non-lysosomal ceramidase N-terminal domain-containing protein [Fulvivirga sedimenti]